MNAIFPKYLNLLTRETKAHVVYVTPSKLINETLEVFKLKFELKERKGELGKVDSEVFSRLHIVPSNQFQKTFEILLDNDPLVNRRID
jgi:predicted nucleotidyltransferase